ncbi:TPA: serine/threonine protein kinase [Candidatus Bathyarchaeota archaeon]|nr:serine/threonine protein kinase [Candidatus Bathyarchaeota archaeon]
MALQKIMRKKPFEGLVYINLLTRKPFKYVICYPQYGREELKKRINEMKNLGIEAVEFCGKRIVCNLSVLGKGCVGIVIMAHTPFGRAALKIRRTDANRKSMHREAEMLKKANSVDVGPKLLGYSENLLLTEFVDGILLPEWLESIRRDDDITKLTLKKVLLEIVKQSRRLDSIGLDHGELSKASKHIIVRPDGNVCIVDFESASTFRRASNVTSVCQFLFIKGQASKRISKILGVVSRERLISALRTYKKNKSDENFCKILKICGLV